MKRLLAIIQKERAHILRDPRSLLILFGMPVVQVVLFGFALTNEIKDARVAVLDRSKDEVTRDLQDHLSSSGYFRITKDLASDGVLEDAFKGTEVDLALVFEEGFAEKFQEGNGAELQVLADASDPNSARTLVNSLRSVVERFQAASFHKKPQGIRTEVTMAYNPRQQGVYLFVPGVITVVLMLISAMMTSITLAREKEMGTMEVLMVSPLRPLTVIIGKTIPYMVLSFIIGLLLLFLGRFVFDLPVEGGLGLLLAESLLFIITSLSLGILISTLTNSQQVALMISLFVLMMPTILLSGFIFPIDSMPEILQGISHVIPARWFNQIIKGILLKGNGIGDLIKETSILLAMSGIFIALSYKNFKVRST